ncbi:hypothetical protein B1B04_24820 [Lysinibacillus sp. KCTC 33748]|uniref:SPRY domain-containing protein n=1 Tax=unclassified Lysinibacillus TaxID=2636778 RepID=UPI0009A60C82|nr:MULTISPECIES: SPRY domain-containing protein [unclassified Lysinibacillus]OXS65765.1 hypothetical protein B1B04_24820 [Lysinibacillus sp. KCTC 33748]SKC19236.1 F5/8 type C domain-containing protein [Lysinibacillus sp. AC-3]
MLDIDKVTWDSAKINHSATVFSNNDLTAFIKHSNQTVVANYPRSSGKWYFELKMGSILNVMVGIVSAKSGYGSTYNSTLSRYYAINGSRIEGNTSQSYGVAYSNNDIIGIALNLDDGTIEFYKNGVSQGIAFRNIYELGEVYPAFTTNGTSSSITVTAIFEEQLFNFPIPNGYKSYGLLPYSKTLLQSNNKTYSLDSIDTWYDTKMTSDNVPSPLVASASSVYSSTFPAWRAFDGLKDSNGWSTATNSIINQWLRLYFGKYTRVNKVTVVARSTTASTESPKNFDFQGSNDALNWTTLKEVRNQIGWKNSEERTYRFDKEGYFKYYQIFVYDFNGDTSPVIGEVIYGCEYLSFCEIPSISKGNFIKYGAKFEFNGLEAIALDKNYILQDGVSENSDGLWTTKLDRKPLSISFN